MGGCGILKGHVCERVWSPWNVEDVILRGCGIGLLF